MYAGLQWRRPAPVKTLAPENKKLMKTQFLKYAVVLGLITAIGPFAIDMYLPALPSIKQSFGASTAEAQMSLMVFFIALGICQQRVESLDAGHAVEHPGALRALAGEHERDCSPRHLVHPVTTEAMRDRTASAPETRSSTMAAAGSILHTMAAA